MMDTMVRLGDVATAMVKLGWVDVGDVSDTRQLRTLLLLLSAEQGDDAAATLVTERLRQDGYALTWDDAPALDEPTRQQPTSPAPQPTGQLGLAL